MSEKLMEIQSPIILPAATPKLPTSPSKIIVRKADTSQDDSPSKVQIFKVVPSSRPTPSFGVNHVTSTPGPPGSSINSINNKEHLINATLSNIYSDNLHDNYFPGIASLIDSLDRPLLVHLRDRRTIIGCLSSIDSYGNLLLSDTVERVYAMDFHADIPRGLYIVRGENVALAGEIELESEDTDKVRPLQQILAWQEAERLGREERKRRIRHMSYEAGILQLDDSLEDDFYQWHSKKRYNVLDVFYFYNVELKYIEF